MIDELTFTKAIPILAKQLQKFDKPPVCSIKSIRF